LKDKQVSVPATELPMTSPSLVSEERPFLIDFEMLNGNHVALPYTSVLFVSFNPSQQIVILFATHTVRIKGVNLKPIYEALLREAVGTLKEVSDRPHQYPKNVPLVFWIAITQRGKDSADDEMEPSTE
jgi:hypothetical protein